MFSFQMQRRRFPLENINSLTKSDGFYLVLIQEERIRGIKQKDQGWVILC